MISTARGTPQINLSVHISLLIRILQRSTSLCHSYGATTSILGTSSWDSGFTVDLSPLRTQVARPPDVYSLPGPGLEIAHSRLAHYLMQKSNASSPAAQQ